jgi:hypothetical protein
MIEALLDGAVALVQSQFEELEARALLLVPPVDNPRNLLDALMQFKVHEVSPNLSL